MVTVADVLYAFFLEHIDGIPQQRVAEHVFWRNSVPTLGVGEHGDKRDYRFLNGAISRHRPAKHRTIAVGAGDFMSTDRSKKSPAALMHFGTDGQRHRRKYGAGKELGATLLDLCQHFSDA